MLGLIAQKRPTPSAGALAGRYDRHAGIHVLRLSGDDYEMGYQHGALLADAIPRGPVPYFDGYVQKMLGSAGGPIVGAALAALLQQTVGRRIAAGFPEHMMQALNGLADGAGISRGKLLRGFTMPECFLWLIQRSMKLRGAELAPRHGVPLMGCTSAIAWGGETRDGAMLHGRNFDYQGVGAWDHEQAVVFHRPKDGQAYVSVAAAGILSGGVTAMNASGLTLVMHQHMGSEDLSLGGVPVGVTGDLVMRHAKTLDEARRILDDHTPNGCWTYVLASASESAVLCYEVTPARRASFSVDAGSFAYSNVFFDPEVGKSEREVYPSHWRNVLARLRRARHLLDESSGSIDENTIASILGNPGDDGCRFESAISLLMTVASVVFKPGDGLVYVGTGRAPTSNRDYVAFDLKTESARADLPPLTGGHLGDPAATDAFDAYRDGYEAYFNRGDVTAARAHVDRAARLQPKLALYRFVAGLLALHDGDFTGASRDLDAAVELGHPEPEREAAFHLWRGRALDARGRRDEAVAAYRVAQRGHGNVNRSAIRGLERAWKPKRFAIEFAFADVPMP